MRLISGAPGSTHPRVRTVAVPLRRAPSRTGPLTAVRYVTVRVVGRLPIGDTSRRTVRVT